MLRLLDRLQPLALLALRVAVAVVLIAHGKSKVFGGIHAHATMVGSLGLPPWLGYLSAGTEFFGGILLLLGLLTRFVGVAVMIEMLVAIFKVHLKNGVTGTPQASGYQLPLLVCAIGFALIWFGAGPISLDWLFGGRKGRG